MPHLNQILAWLCGYTPPTPPTPPRDRVLICHVPNCGNARGTWQPLCGKHMGLLHWRTQKRLWRLTLRAYGGVEYAVAVRAAIAEAQAMERFAQAHAGEPVPAAGGGAS